MTEKNGCSRLSCGGRLNCPVMKKEARIVIVPSAGAGHIASTIELAKLLVNHDHRLWVTVLVIKFPFDRTSGSSYAQSLASTERVNLINLPECPTDSESSGFGQMNAVLESQKPNIKEAVSNLTGPPLAAFVVDMFCTAIIDVAKHFGVPSLVFYTSGLAFLGLMLHLHTLRERDNAEFNDSDAEFIIPSFASPVPLKVLPSLAINKEWDSFFLAYGKGLKKADGFIINSFEELESHAVHFFTHSPQPIYPVGPLLNPKAHAHVHADADNTDTFNWLDHQPPSSVIFLCFGSMGSFPEDQVREIASALENTGARFLWSLRKPQPKGSMSLPSDYPLSDLPAILPPGFLDRTAEIGKIIGWAPQAQILAHPATAGFVSHCGWNSTLESVYYGVPVATWPLYAEQQMNAFELVCELKMAVEIALDYRVDFRTGPNTLLTADKIEKGIRSLMNIDQDIKNRVKEMSEKSRKTLLQGGCSYSYLGRFTDYIMNQV
ncbi:hypothetical protein VNO77_29549 [Canavalia gladiata]|uniref:Glycosyltransferase n=1 Tax=Canavalia gladiata TaxID=3824 RepID=A0AAN9KQ14_CANGL